MEDRFEGWDQDLIDEYVSAPSEDLYNELAEVQVFRSENREKLSHGYPWGGKPLIGAEPNAEYLAHYGTPRHSGRYPWGSGKNPQRNRNFLQRADDLKAQGLSEVEIAKAFGLSSGDYRAIRKHYTYQVAMENQQEAEKLKAKGWSNIAIADKLGVSEGTVRNLLNPSKKKRENTVQNVADHLKDLLKEKPYLDIGEGVARQLNISDDTLKAVRLVLEDEGYNVHDFRLPQINNPKQFTNMLVLTEGDKTKADVKQNIGKLSSPDGLYFEDYGETAKVRKPIPSIDSSRIAIRYAEDGGGEKDGVMEIRPGTEDISLGGRNYAQVRIGVDGTHYLKGMAVYSTDPKSMPAGVDIVFNTSKHKGTPMLGPNSDESVLKPMKKDPANPFGAAFRQWEYDGADGTKHVSPVNIVNDDEDWDKWKNNLSAQFLSKQLPAVAKQQLDIRYGEMAKEFNDIKSLTNPTLKKQFLEEFADNCDSAAVHLKAAALPRQGAYAILPITSLKDNEVYAPMYKEGEEVILVRHPHEGIFQIPKLTVTHSNPDGIKMLGTAPSHAIGINSTVANQLSGADYDGDTVLVIPTEGQKLRSMKAREGEPLHGLLSFNPSDVYYRSPDDPMCTGKSRDGKKGDGFNKGKEMGVASNLITDMTIKKADPSEIERAVRYSMTVIDAEKHNLDWKKAYKDNGIAQLKKLYQFKYTDETGKEHFGGASTLISRARSETRIPERKEIYSTSGMTDEEKERYANGEIIYRETGKSHKNSKTGKYEPNIEKKEAMAIVKDANELSSGYYIESVYAAHANRLKALANEARKEMRNTGRLEQNKSAAEAYADIVGKDGTLAKKILRAELESPKERQAQALATSIMTAKKEADPSLAEDKDKWKKLNAKALNDAREAVNNYSGEKRYRITLTDREWEAIQAGAISDTTFKRVIRYSDKNELKKRAMPRESTGMSASAKSRARLLLNSGKSPSYVAEELGVSLDTLRKEFNNFNGMGVE